MKPLNLITIYILIIKIKILIVLKYIKQEQVVPYLHKMYMMEYMNIILNKTIMKIKL